MDEQITDTTRAGANVMAAEVAAETAVPATNAAETPVLEGDGITNVVRAPKRLPGAAPSKAEVLMAVAQRMLESMKKIASNLGPSKEASEKARRRQKEIRKIQQELRDQKIDLEQARILLINMADAEDRVELARQIDRAAEMIKC